MKNSPTTLSKTVLVIGNLIEKEDVLQMVDVIERVTKKAAVRFVIAGPLNNKKLWTTEINKRGVDQAIEFRAVIHPSDLAYHLRGCDLLLDSTEAGSRGIEAHELAVLEAMRFGKPVVTSKSLEEIKVVEHCKTGIIIDTKSPREICATVVRLFENERMTKELAKRGKHFVTGIFDFSAFSLGSLASYKKVTNFAH